MRNYPKLLRATLTASLMLAAMAWVGFAQVEADPIDMRVWVGKYPLKEFPTDAIYGSTFLESPRVQNLITMALGPDTVSQMKIMGVVSPIIRRGDWVIAQGCYPHRCNDGDWIVAINWLTLETRVCLALVDSGTIRFGETGKQYTDLPRGRDELCTGLPVFAHIFGQTIASGNPSNREEVPLKKEGGTFVVPVQINGAITLDFTIDSGASDVSIPSDVFSTLVRTGTIRDTDTIGEQTYILADGSKLRSATFTIRSLKVGDKVLENVKGSVAPAQGSLLLGQSFFERFKSWSIDNAKHELVLESQ